MVLFFTLLRLATAPTFGLGVDEAHYALYAMRLDWSYVDHPPLVGWLHAPFYLLFGTSPFLVRLPAILLFACVSVLCYIYTLGFSRSRSTALLAVLAINSSFMLNAMSLMLLPDCLLLVLIFPCMALVRRIAEGGRWRDFLGLGIVLGLAGLAKYTAILFVPPILLYLLMKRQGRLLLSPKMVMAAFVALMIVTPVLYWNFLHDFISFRYQGGHVLGPAKASLSSFSISLLAQFGAYSPPLFLMAFYGFLKGFASRDDRIRLSVLFCGTLMLFFLYASLYERTLPHWPSLFYLLFIPVGVHFLREGALRRKRNLLYASLGFSLFLTLFLYGALAGKWLPFPDYKSPFRDIYGVEEMIRKANGILAADPSRRKALAVTNWTLGSRAMYYGSASGMRVFVLDDRRDQFDYWEPQAPVGWDLLFLNTHFHNAVLPERFSCGSYEPAGSLTISLKGGRVDDAAYIWCRNYQGEKR